MRTYVPVMVIATASPPPSGVQKANSGRYRHPVGIVSSEQPALISHFNKHAAKDEGRGGEG